MKKTFRSSVAAAAAAASALTLIAGATAGAAAAQGSGAKGDIDLVTPSATIDFGGSSFSAPYVTYLTTKSDKGSYNSLNASVTFGTDGAQGSGTGRADVENGTFQIGFSDQPLNVAAGTAPSGYTQAQVDAQYAQAPIALGGAVVGYHINGVTATLNLSAGVIAGIYNGSITNWSDKAIHVLNPKVTLPNLPIVVLYRSASSGTTFAFTDYLHSAAGTSQPVSGAVMEGPGAKWAATTVQPESNNGAMASGINTINGAIGYVEYSYVLNKADAKIQVADLQDAAGQFIAPSLTTIAAAATAAKGSLSSTNFSIVDLPGKNVWPFATYTWAIVKTAAPSAAQGEAEVKFLDYFTHGGQTYANANGFVALPAAAAAYARTQLGLVKYNGTVLLTKKN